MIIWVAWILLGAVLGLLGSVLWYLGVDDDYE